MINVSVDKGFLRVVGEISVASGKEELETFVGEINWQLLGDRKSSRLPSFGVVAKELNEADAAIYIGRSKSFLRACRHDGKQGEKGRKRRGPKYTRYGPRSIRYPVAELDKWLAGMNLYEVSCEEQRGCGDWPGEPEEPAGAD